MGAASSASEVSFTCSEPVPYASCHGIMRTAFLDKIFLSSLIRDFFKEKKKKRCKIKCMFTCPRSEVLNTKVTLS